MSKIINYYLGAPEKDYQDLISAINAYPECAKLAESTWMIVSDDSCVKVRNDLFLHMDSNDKLFVAELSGIAAWQNLDCNYDYFRKNLQNKYNTFK